MEQYDAQAERSNMVRPNRSLLMLLVYGALAGVAMAEDTTIGLETKLVRAPDDLSEPKNTKVEINAAHTFANDVVVGGSFQTQKSTSGVWSYHLEGTLGYGFKLTNYASLSGSAGVGERWRPATSGGDITYYVLRVKADIDLSERWSWNVITYRYRDAFDPANNYNTPEVSTGITFKIDSNNSIYMKYLYDWHDGPPSAQAFAFGYKYGF